MRISIGIFIVIFMKIVMRISVPTVAPNYFTNGISQGGYSKHH